MACTDKCKPYNKTTASNREYEGHNTWKVDYAEAGMPRYGLYFQAPCLSVLFTFFNDGVIYREVDFMGVISRDSYGAATATLYILPERNPVWQKTYTARECGAEPFDDLYRQHAIAMVDKHGTGGHERGFSA